MYLIIVLSILNYMKNIAIIGAGPAGIFTAILLNKFKGNIHLFEQNSDIGEKLKLTGGGKMNITNKVFSEQEFSSSINNLLKKIFKNHHAKEREEIFKKLGIKYFYEKNRAILKSEDANLEVARLKKVLINQKNLKLHLNTKILEINSNKNGLELKSSKEIMIFDTVIITTGGMYRLKDCGTKEEIYKLSNQTNHTLTTLSPSLCPLLFSDLKLKNFSGISFNGKLTDNMNNKSIQGDILITHFGLSGPAVLDFTANEKSGNISLCFTTKITKEKFIKEFNKMRNGKNSIKKFLKNYLPQRLIDFHLHESEISENFMSDLPKIKLKKLTDSIFNYSISNIKPNTYPSSWTTRGGIPLTEINTATFQSKKHPNIYFAGEVLDVNGLCGGYNISFAAISAAIIADGILKLTSPQTSQTTISSPF